MMPIDVAHSARPSAGGVASAVRRSVSAALLALAVVAAGAVASCGSSSHGNFNGTGNNGSGDSGVGLGGGGLDASAPPIAGLTSITVTPAMSSLALTYPVSSSGATVQLTATGTFQDGHTADVTGTVDWTLTPRDIATVNGGAFASQAPGTFTVAATAGTISGTASVAVMLTGTVVGSGVTQGDLDGTPSGTAPTIAYPLDGSLFPFQLGPIEFQVVPASAAQTEARIAFEGDSIDLKVYEPCVPIPTPAIANGCTITVPADLETLLDGASESAKLTETVRLSAPGGGSLAESMPISARWSSSQLHGGLYYWSADIASGNTLIMRYNLDTPGTPPEQYFTETSTDGGLSSEQAMDPPQSTGQTQCFGCHAISLDGTKIGLTFGGSQPSLFALIDVASEKTIATRLFSTDPNAGAPFAAFSAFSPDGTALVQSVQSQLFLRSADANLMDINPGPLFAGALGSDVASTPFWAAQGDFLAFTGWVPCVSCEGVASDPADTNGDETPNAEIWLAPVTNGTTFGTPTKLVPTVSGKSEYYPAISDDSLFVVFDESSCDGPGAPAGEGYGTSPCDGYDDASATVRLVSTKGGTPVYLDNANQRDNWSNSWPRFAPTHGTFQADNLYWIAFSSRHPYGATLPGTNNPTTMDTEPQLWFAAVTIDPSGTLSADPSFAPVWMPQQNPGGTQRGNHSPQWVTKSVPVVPK